MYNEIINNAINSNRVKGNIYYENHHITPKSMGGSNSNNNLVLLTAREHFICHYLLTKFTTGNAKNKMIYAFNIMAISGNNQQRYINSRLFESNKNDISKNHHMKQDTSGYIGIKNGNAEIIDVYDDKGVLFGTSYGNWQNFIIKNSLPSRLAWSYRNSGQKIYMSGSSTSVFQLNKSGNIRYVGWYAVRRNLKEIKTSQKNYSIITAKADRYKKHSEFMKNRIISNETKTKISKSKMGKNSIFKILISPEGQKYLIQGSKGLYDFCVVNNLSFTELNMIKNNGIVIVKAGKQKKRKSYITKLNNTIGWNIQKMKRVEL